MSPTHGFKFEAPDGKQRIADVLNSDGVIILAKHYPNNRASKFLDWFTYSDNTIDGQSRKKAYTLFESGLLNSLEPGSMKCLQQIHAYLFGGLYEFAGQIRNKNISKGGLTFANCLHFPTIIPTIERMPETTLDEIASSHLARRTFIGNLYKKVKDPNLVGSLSGHKEGSKAFARYRDIDEDMKKELVDLLD